MHSIISQPHTSLLRACWTLARIPHLLATHGLHLITCTATSAHGSCELRTVRLRRFAVFHFFPHLRPPDTHALEVGAACLEYQGSLVNTYSSLVLRNMPKQQRARHSYRPDPAVARPQAGLDLLGDNTLDEDDARASDDDARDTSMSSSRGGFVGFGGRRPDRAPSPSPATSAGAARERDARDLRDHDDHGRYTAWKKADFPTDDTLRPCKVKWHEDLPRHIYLLFDILGIQFRWFLTRMGVVRTLVSSEELAVDDTKDRTWMAVYAHDRDVIEDLLYRRLKTLWSGCTDAIAIFSHHRAGEELCAQKVWDALLTAFPLNHKRMQTVLLACECSRLMAWDGHSKADVDRHFGDVSDTLQMLKFLERNIDITDVFKSVVLATLKSSKNKALTKAYASILDNLDDDQRPYFRDDSTSVRLQVPPWSRPWR